ncbi:MAG: ATP-binding protein [Myxococcota bacterium]
MIQVALGLGSDQLDSVFPFHFGFDEDCRLLQQGRVLGRLLPELKEGDRLSDHFVITQPVMAWRQETIQQRTKSFFLIQSRERPNLMLRGQMVHLPQHEGATLFVGSPWFTELKGLSGLGLTLRDFAPCDPVYDLLLLLQAESMSLNEASQLADRLTAANEDLERRVEERTAELGQANQDLKAEMQRRQQVEQELRLAQKLESVGQLAAGVAHEINTPTQYLLDNNGFIKLGIESLFDLIQAYRKALQTMPRSPQHDAIDAIEEEKELDYLTEELPEALGQSQEGLQQISRIVGAMKEFSHPGSEAFSSVDLNRAIQTIVTLSSTEWKYHSELKTELSPDLPAVHGREGDIKQALLNLVVNAAHAVRDNRHGKSGQIVIRSLATDHTVQIEVEDNGCGIPEAIRHRIYDPFFTTKEVGSGTGQGLSLVHTVMDRHKGEVSFRTSIDEGTTFMLTFPRSL